MEVQTITELLPQLGLSGVFLGFLIIVWRYFERQIDLYKEEIAKKDEQLEQLNSKVLEAFTENTKVVEGMRNASETQATAIRTLTENVYDVIRRK